MTFSGEFRDDPMEERSYPTLFGLTLTPAVSGALVAVVGLGGAIYFGIKLLAPAYARQQELKASVEKKETELTQKQETVRNINEIKASVDRAKALNADVRSLFSTQRTLDTLLLDLNRLVVQRDAQLVTFTPDFAASGAISDGSLGPELNNKLKRQVISVVFDGSFSGTLAIFRNMERLQTLLVVKDFSAALKDAAAGQAAGPSSQPQGQVRSSFKLHAYVPLTLQEAAAAAKAAQAATPPK